MFIISVIVVATVTLIAAADAICLDPTSGTVYNATDGDDSWHGDIAATASSTSAVVRQNCTWSVACGPSATFSITSSTVNVVLGVDMVEVSESLGVPPVWWRSGYHVGETLDTGLHHAVVQFMTDDTNTSSGVAMTSGFSLSWCCKAAGRQCPLPNTGSDRDDRDENTGSATSSVIVAVVVTAAIISMIAIGIRHSRSAPSDADVANVDDFTPESTKPKRKSRVKSNAVDATHIDASDALDAPLVAASTE